MFGTLDERVKCLKCSLCLHRDHSTASIIACHIKHNNKFGEFVMNLLHFGVIFMLYLSYTHIVNWVNSDEHDKSIEFMTINFIFRCVPKVFHLFLLYTFLSLFLSLFLWGPELLWYYLCRQHLEKFVAINCGTLGRLRPFGTCHPILSSLNPQYQPSALEVVFSAAPIVCFLCLSF